MAPRTPTKKADAGEAPTPTLTIRRTNPKAPTPTPRWSTAKTTAKSTPAKNSTTRTATPPAEKKAVNQSGLPKLGKGALATAVLDHLRANPSGEYTPTDLARVLNRSGGAIANALEKFVADGTVTQTSQRPRRYRLTPTTPAKRTGTSRKR